MKYQPPALPPEATPLARAALTEALRADRYYIYSDGRQFLRRQGFDPDAVVGHLLSYLDRGARLYVLPGTQGHRIKYQCCLRYENLTVYAKLCRGDGEGDWQVMLGFHDHNTGYAPLPE